MEINGDLQSLRFLINFNIKNSYKTIFNNLSKFSTIHLMSIKFYNKF